MGVHQLPGSGTSLQYTRGLLNTWVLSVHAASVPDALRQLELNQYLEIMEENDVGGEEGGGGRKKGRGGRRGKRMMWVGWGGEGRGGEGWKEKEENDVGREGGGRREEGEGGNGKGMEEGERLGEEGVLRLCTMNHHICTCIPDGSSSAAPSALELCTSG